MMYLGLLTLGLMLALPLLQCGKVMEYQDSDQLGHQQEMIEQPQKVCKKETFLLITHDMVNIYTILLMMYYIHKITHDIF